MTVPGLAGRRIVVTGCTGGIGRAVSAELARASARLVLVGRRPEALESLARDVDGGPHRVEVLDVTDEAAWPRVARDLDREGGVDGLVTAAAVLGPVGPPGTWDLASFRQTLEVNLIGSLAPILALLPALSRVSGAVVTFSGGGATSPLPRYDAYAASKAAVVRLTENLSPDLAARGVRINAVAPGFVVTDIHRATMEAGPEAAGAEYHRRTAEALSTGRADSPEEAAALTAFLLSDAAAGITGKLISARWDPWRDPGYQRRLREDPDLATLRRVDGTAFARRR